MLHRLFTPTVLIWGILLTGLGQDAHAQALNQAAAVFQAKNLYERIARTPGSEAEIASMANLILQGKTDEAAFIPMENVNFYKLNLKRMFQRWTNVEASDQGELNDMTATMIGYVVDNRAFNGVLYESFIYTAKAELIDGAADDQKWKRRQNANFPFVSAILSYNEGQDNSDWDDNRHYEELESRVMDWPFGLERRDVNDLYANLNHYGDFTAGTGGPSRSERVELVDQAGILTQRTFSKAAYLAGTNRRQIKMIMSNFLCSPLEEVHDINVPYVNIRQDIERNPSGSAQAFVSKCSGCHGGMDGLANAFVRMDFDDGSNEIAYYKDLNRVGNPSGNGDPKMFRSLAFENGFDPRDLPEDEQNSWWNHWSTGQNSNLGWRAGTTQGDVTQGVGAKSLGEVLSKTQAFSTCMLEHSFKNICGRDPTPSEAAELATKATSFENGGQYSSYGADGNYNLKAAFALVTPMCFGKIVNVASN